MDFHSPENLAFDIRRAALEDACADHKQDADQVADFWQPFLAELANEVVDTDGAEALYDAAYQAAADAIEYAKNLGKSQYDDCLPANYFN